MNDRSKAPPMTSTPSPGNEIEPTSKEAAAIKELKVLAKRWPKSLWLFSANGELCVMRLDDDGGKVHRDGGGIDPAYILDTVKITNDGGDW